MRSRQLLEKALDLGGLEQLSVRKAHRADVSLRWILIHMVEECVPHNGHADLIRESLDGQTGE